MWEWVHFLCQLNKLHVFYLLRPEEGIGPLDLTGGTDGCEPPRGSWGRRWPLEEQTAL